MNRAAQIAPLPLRRYLMKKFIALISLLTLLSLGGCGGGGGGTNISGTTYYTHTELAREFVRRLEMDLGYDLDLVKINTLQYDYIVVYDYDAGDYDAYWIGSYEVGENLRRYLKRYDYKFYYDLDYLGLNVYEDYWSGLRFEENSSLSRSSSAMQEHLSNVFKRAKAQAVVDKYGLSYGRATELVTIAMNYRALEGKGALTEAEYDAFAMEAVGTSATELIRIAKEEDVVGGLQALKRAADKNGIGIEHARTLLFEDFGLSL